MGDEVRGNRVFDTDLETKSLWYPQAEIGHYTDKRYATSAVVQPRYGMSLLTDQQPFALRSPAA